MEKQVRQRLSQERNEAEIEVVPLHLTPAEKAMLKKVDEEDRRALTEQNDSVSETSDDEPLPESSEMPYATRMMGSLHDFTWKKSNQLPRSTIGYAAQLLERILSYSPKSTKETLELEDLKTAKSIAQNM